MNRSVRIRERRSSPAREVQRLERLDLKAWQRLTIRKVLLLVVLGRPSSGGDKLCRRLLRGRDYLHRYGWYAPDVAGAFLMTDADSLGSFLHEHNKSCQFVKNQTSFFGKYPDAIEASPRRPFNLECWMLPFTQRSERRAWDPRFRPGHDNNLLCLLLVRARMPESETPKWTLHKKIAATRSRDLLDGRYSPCRSCYRRHQLLKCSSLFLALSKRMMWVPPS